jgi:hypothetical protein
MEDEFMPVKTTVNIGPKTIGTVAKGGSATSGAKTKSHNNVMWSHLIGENMEERSKIEIINYEVSTKRNI